MCGRGIAHATREVPLGGVGKPQRDIGDDQARLFGMAEWLVVPRKSGNADGGKGPVSEEAMARALAIESYLVSHAHRAYASGNECETAAAKAILLHIREGDLDEGFTAREIHRKGWSQASSREEVQAGLDLLTEGNYVARNPEQIGPKGGRPTISYRINPKVRW